MDYRRQCYATETQYEAQKHNCEEAFDSVTRAMQSLCNNNVLGILVNGARRGELYSKYTYYHSYYTPKEDGHPDAEAAGETVGVADGGPTHPGEA